jgi:hypothetical protein
MSTTTGHHLMDSNSTIVLNVASVTAKRVHLISLTQIPLEAVQTR